MRIKTIRLIRSIGLSHYYSLPLCPIEFKGIVNRAISIAVPLVPVQASEQVLALIQELVQKTYPPTEPNELSRNCPIYLEWDAAISFVECWVNGLRMHRLLQVQCT